jgi:hypothetical protein
MRKKPAVQRVQPCTADGFAPGSKSGDALLIPQRAVFPMRSNACYNEKGTLMAFGAAGGNAMLFHELRQAENQVAALRSKINQCAHEFDESPSRCEVITIDLGESIGTKRVFVMAQRRRCGLCGLEQSRMQHDPDCDYGSWK